MIKFLISLFSRKKQENEVIPVKKRDPDIMSPDFIDYDGMGNQGRFPSRNDKPR